MSSFNETAHIALSRSGRRSRDVFRSYAVILDGAEIGRIKRGKRFDFPVTPGDHDIYLRIDWARSQIVNMTVEPGELVELFCEPGGSAASGFNDIAEGSYITLTRLSIELRWRHSFDDWIDSHY